MGVDMGGGSVSGIGVHIMVVASAPGMGVGVNGDAFCLWDGSWYNGRGSANEMGLYMYYL